MAKRKNAKRVIPRLPLEQNPLANSLQNLTLQFEEKINELSLLRRVGDIVGYIFNFETFYRMLLDIVLEETNAENCSFMIMEAATHKLVVKWARGRNDHGTFFDHIIDFQTAFSLGEGICGKAALKKKPILVKNVKNDKNFVTKQTRYSIGTLLSSPLVYQNKILGIINISHSQSHIFGQGTRRVMEILCAFISSIIGNAIDHLRIRDEENFRAMFEGVKLPIMLIDTKTERVINCNTQMEKWLGYTKSELILFDHALKIIPPENRGKTEQILHNIAKKNNFEYYEIPFTKKDGSVLIGEINGATISYQENIVIQLTIRDVTEQKKAEEALIKSEERYHGLIEHANDAIISIDRKGIIIDFNKKAEELYGYTRKEILGKPIEQLIPPQYRERQRKALKKLSITNDIKSVVGETQEGTGYRKNGTEFHTEVSRYALEVQGEYIITALIRDISERKQMEKRLFQSEKLRSLGELAGGVAHDFNNILTAIIGRVQLLNRLMTPPFAQKEKRHFFRTLKDGLSIIERAALDGAETVRRIQEFSKKRDDEYFTTLDINKIINDALEFTKTKWKDEAESKEIGIKIKKNFFALPPISGNPSELRELFTNLINNAVDAMPSGGEICIKTSMNTNKGLAVVTLRDTGIGVQKELLDRIFDPFFTTKGVQSTGLGLSVSYGIVSRHRGTIKIDSIEDKGTTFTIHLPLSKIKRTEGKAEKETKHKKQTKANILVIEDEEEVREIITDILISHGHEVSTASDGNQGIEIFNKKDFDLVFTDLGMPGISGWQVAKEIKKIGDKTPVALITGWSVKLNQSEMKKNGVDAVINKPFNMKQLLRLVNDCIEFKTPETSSGVRIGAHS